MGGTIINKERVDLKGLSIVNLTRPEFTKEDIALINLSPEETNDYVWSQIMNI